MHYVMLRRDSVTAHLAGDQAVRRVTCTWEASMLDAVARLLSPGCLSVHCIACPFSHGFTNMLAIAFMGVVFHTCRCGVMVSHMCFFLARMLVF